jgi:deoxyribodipyrimidine photo-lyase
MNEKQANGLFIFRRDLRIVDNIGLNVLSKLCNNVYTIFIFTPEQVGSANKYKSDNSVQFMIESLADLASEIRKNGGQLHTFYGKNTKVLADCIKAWDINIVAFNSDITPYARERDDDIVKMCQKMGVDVKTENDYYLHPPGSIKTMGGEPYQKFTPYYEKASKIKVPAPIGKKQLPFKTTDANVPNKISLEEAMKRFTKINPNILVQGGRPQALQLLSRAVRTIHNYNAIHNDLSLKTSELSASIKFGCISIREAYKALHDKPGIIRQLYWRDFYANIMYEFPHVIGHSLKPKYDKIHWHHNSKWFDAWCKGETGYPIVDAGMRQMNTTGYMHNRARLIVASFLVKTLLIDWREGEEYFAKTLTDYDPSNNNGNWQWISGGGADSQPYFRVFNPWRQAESYDPKCEYIKKWVPELNDVPAKDLLKWDTKYLDYKDISYPKPIVRYEDQREQVLKLYASIF